MHILYIYREYMGRRKKYGDEIIKLGHKVSFIKVKDKKTSNQVAKNVIMQHKPDMVWLLNPSLLQNNVISKEAVEYIKQKSIPLVVYSTFNTQIAYTEMDKTWKAFDFFFAHQKDFCKYLKNIGVNSYYMPVAFYSDQYWPLKLDETMQISFAGSPQTQVSAEDDRRVKYLKALSGFDIKIFGKSFNKRGVSASHYGSHKQENNIYARSMVNLDLPFVNSSLEFYKYQYHLKNRFFEVPASNNFLMTVRCEEFLELLDESMVGYFDDDIESMKETVSRYLRDKAEREKMAMKAYKEVINNHTFSHRFKKMFDIIGGI